MSRSDADPIAPPPHLGLKESAQAWFEELRDQLCAKFEAIDNALPSDRPAGRFVRTRWPRRAAAKAR
jgi:coproporphyrinogen III oxidase